MSTKTKPEDYTGREFVITRDFAAPCQKVFQAWTDPKLLAQWWGPRDFTNPVCQWDVRPGGKINHVMRAPDGQEHGMGGEFREIIPPEKLVFSCGALDKSGEMQFEFLHSATFSEMNGKTKLTLRARVLRVRPEANMYIAWFEPGMNQSLDRLAELLQKAG